MKLLKRALWLLPILASGLLMVSAQDVGYPLEPPNIAAGSQLYDAHCAQCHGNGGRGDGPTLPAGQPRPADFRNPQTASGQRPTEWFAAISGGRLTEIDHTWSEQLSETERWQVALFTYTMAYATEQISLGAQTWTTHCAECHGSGGRGDGPKAATISRPVGDLTDQAEVATLSDSVFYNIASEGVGQMPAFADKIDETARQAVAAYVRTLSLSNTERLAQADPSATGRVSGQVRNGTTAGSLPPTLTLALLRDDGTEIASTPMNADGSFAFEGIDIQAEHSYFVATTYRDRRFTSALTPGTSSALTIPLTLYELTEDPAVISIRGISTRIVPMRFKDIGDGLEVTQTLLYRNASDRVFTTSRALREGTYAALVVPLPPGAIVLAVDNEERYVIAQEQFTLIDTLPVMPGDDHPIQVIYFIPYTDGAIIEQEIAQPLAGTVRLAVWPEAIQVSSEQLAANGEETNDDQTFRLYEGTLTLQAGEVLRYELQGSGLAAIQPAQPGLSLETILPLLVLLLAVIAVGVIVYTVLRGGKPASSQTPAAISRQLATLEAQHEAGQINHDLYHQRKRRLQAQLDVLSKKEPQ